MKTKFIIVLLAITLVVIVLLQWQKQSQVLAANKPVSQPIAQSETGNGNHSNKLAAPKLIDPNTGQFITNGQSSAVPARMMNRAFKIDEAKFFQNLERKFPANNGESHLETLRRFFTQNGVNFDSPAGLALNESKQLLFVRNTKTNVDAAERLIVSINSDR